MLLTILSKMISPEAVINTPSIDQRVERAKRDLNERNELLAQYAPFMIKVASKVCKQYIDRTRDEFSIAMQAFNEAIEAYDGTQGTHFLSFAELVIRRRVIDYIRKESRQRRDIWLESGSNDEDVQAESATQVHASLVRYQEALEQERRKEEIEEYGRFLSTFNITFAQLAESSPKHVDARENAKEIARILASKPELAQFLMSKKQLPLKELLKYVRCSRKTVERNRKYIIAVALIYIGQFDTLRAYID